MFSNQSPNQAHLQCTLAADVRLVEANKMQVCAQLYGNPSVMDVGVGHVLPKGAKVLAGNGRGFVVGAGQRSTLSQYFNHLREGLDAEQSNSIVFLQGTWIYRIGLLVATLLVLTELEKHLVKHELDPTTSFSNEYTSAERIDFFRRSLGIIMSAFPVALDPAMRLAKRIGLKRFRRYGWNTGYKCVENLATLTNVILPNGLSQGPRYTHETVPACRMYVAEEWYSFDATSIKRHITKFALTSASLRSVLRCEQTGSLLRFLALFAGNHEAPARDVALLKATLEAWERANRHAVPSDDDEDPSDNPTLVVTDFVLTSAEHPLTTAVIVDTHHDAGVVVCKGPLNEVLNASTYYRNHSRQKERISKDFSEKLRDIEADLAEAGNRVLAVAARSIDTEDLQEDGTLSKGQLVEKDLVLLGLVATTMLKSEVDREAANKAATERALTEASMASHSRILQMLEDRIQFHILTPEHHLTPFTLIGHSMKELAENEAFHHLRAGRVQARRGEKEPYCEAVRTASMLNAVDAREFMQIPDLNLTRTLQELPDIIGHACPRTLTKLSKALLGRYANACTFHVEEPPAPRDAPKLPMLDIRTQCLTTPNLHADIVVNDSTLAGLLNTIRLSRSIFSRSCEVTTLTCSAHLCELIISAVDAFAQTEHTLLDPFQILYTNVVTLGLMSMALAAVPYRASRTGHASGIQCGGKMLLSIFKNGIVFAFFTWASYFYSRRLTDASAPVCRSVTLTTLNIMIVLTTLSSCFHYSTGRLRNMTKVGVIGAACILLVVGWQYIPGINTGWFGQLPLESGSQLAPIVIFPMAAAGTIELLKRARLREDEPATELRDSDTEDDDDSEEEDAHANAPLQKRSTAKEHS